MSNLLEIRTCRRKGIAIFKPVIIPQMTYNFVQPLMLRKIKMNRHWIVSELYSEQNIEPIIKCTTFYDKVTSGYVLITFCVFEILLAPLPSISNSGKSLSLLA